ncbi:MAG: RNA 2',3'-cyclic phosphodiesterase [Euryarchaeota archaeon]|nr:RNA 2',3'-cyclic phosphodiesterase [Euryarchaeota archaeon]
MDKIRAFIAIDIPKDLINKIANIQNSLKKIDANIKYVEPENIHITLKFLGEVLENKLANVSLVTKETTVGVKPFEIEINGVGVFPSFNYIRVIWVGITKGADFLSNLQTELEKRLVPLGFEPEERGFSPHITIGRVKTIKAKAQLQSKINELQNINIGTMQVDCLKLKKSQLTPKGPIYTDLVEVKFQ